MTESGNNVLSANEKRKAASELAELVNLWFQLSHSVVDAIMILAKAAKPCEISGWSVDGHALGIAADFAAPICNSRNTTSCTNNRLEAVFSTCPFEASTHVEMVPLRAQCAAVILRPGFARCGGLGCRIAFRCSFQAQSLDLLHQNLCAYLPRRCRELFDFMETLNAGCPSGGRLVHLAYYDFAALLRANRSIRSRMRKPSVPDSLPTTGSSARRCSDRPGTNFPRRRS